MEKLNQSYKVSVISLTYTVFHSTNRNILPYGASWPLHERRYGYNRD